MICHLYKFVSTLKKILDFPIVKQAPDMNQVLNSHSAFESVSQPKKMENKISIHIGEYYVSREPTIIETFLGSCVAVCLFDPKTKNGGMNHFLLPGSADLKELKNPARYSINAIEILINTMMKLGANRKTIEAKVFGGANVLPRISDQGAVGSKISEFVVSFLKQEDIYITRSDLGGVKSRKIYLFTDTGEVLLRRSHSMKSSQHNFSSRNKMLNS